MSPDLSRDDTIIIVSGLPRSGTSLMMQILDRAGVPILHDDARKPDISNPRGYYELEAVKATHRDASWVDRAPGCGAKVIHAHLPHLPRDRRYRVLMMERDLDQVIRSQDRMLNAAGAESPASISPERVGRVFVDQLDRLRELLDAEECFDWLPVDYAALVLDPVPRVADALAFIRVNASPEEAAEAVDPSLFRNRD